MWIQDLNEALANFPKGYDNTCYSKVIPGGGCIIFRSTGFFDLVYYPNTKEWKKFNEIGEEVRV